MSTSTAASIDHSERLVSGPPLRLPVEPGRIVVWVLIAVTALIVVPPLLFLIAGSFTVESIDSTSYGFANFLNVLNLSGWRVWRITLTYAIGSSCIAIVIGVTAAWLAARTNAPFRRVAVVSAYLSLSAPVMVKAIGWILLLGPNKGVINEALRSLFDLDGVPIPLFTLGGMTIMEGVLWVPFIFLLMMPAMSAMDPSLEESALMSGATLRQTFFRVTLRLAMPSMLAVLLLTFIRSLESFEIPLLIGTPANQQTFTTAIYETTHRGFLPRYGEACAYATMLIVVVLLPLLGYYRVTRHAQKYATITGKGFRPTRVDLGTLRIPAGVFLLIIPITLLAPLLILLWGSFLPIYQSPSLADLGRMSWHNYYSVLTNPITISGLWNGALVATLSATAVSIFTFILGWTVVRRRETERWLLDILASLPLVLPGIVLSTAVLIQFLHTPFIPIYDTVWIMVVAFMIRFTPYGIRFCHAGVVSLHVSLEECARICGAGIFTTLRRVVLPLTLPAVMTVWIYVFLYSIRDLSVPIMLAGPENRLIAVVILDLWNEGKVPEVGALSVLLALIAAVLGWFFVRFGRRFGVRAL